MGILPSTVEKARRRGLGVAGVLAALVVLHMGTFDRGLGGDGWATFSELSELTGHGDVWLEGRHFGVENGLIRTAAGHLVAQYPPGRTTVCFVNPANPAEAVLYRGYNWEMAYGLIGLILALCGAMGFLFSWRAVG